MWIWIAAAVVVIVALIAFATNRRRSSEAMRKRFGPEYDRTVASTGSPKAAEAELARRERRVRALDLKPLTPGARSRYVESWRAVQARFVDDPSGAIADADRLLTDAMRDRGYPVDDANQRLEDLSVEHAGTLNNYRTAAAIAQRNARGQAGTEELRQAMVSYRTLFSELVGADPTQPGSVEGRTVEPVRTDATQGVR
jgi:hypothetical protein